MHKPVPLPHGNCCRQDDHTFCLAGSCPSEAHIWWAEGARASLHLCCSEENPCQGWARDEPVQTPYFRSGRVLGLRSPGACQHRSVHWPALAAPGQPWEPPRAPGTSPPRLTAKTGGRQTTTSRLGRDHRSLPTLRGASSGRKGGMVWPRGRTWWEEKDEGALLNSLESSRERGFRERARKHTAREKQGGSLGNAGALKKKHWAEVGRSSRVYQWKAGGTTSLEAQVHDSF